MGTRQDLMPRVDARLPRRHGEGNKVKGTNFLIYIFKRERPENTFTKSNPLNFAGPPMIYKKFTDKVLKPAYQIMCGLVRKHRLCHYSGWSEGPLRERDDGMCK